ncbi:MAG: hypothetical protein WAL50_16680, partial [Kineosporiaceae bacterium]
MDGDEAGGYSEVATFAEVERIVDSAGTSGGASKLRNVVTRFRSTDADGASSKVLVHRYRQIIIASDMAAGLAAGILSLVVRFGAEATASYIAISLLAPALWVAAVASQRGYESRFLGTGPDEYRRLADATLVLFALTAAVSFAFKGDLSRGYIVVALPVALGLSFVGRRQLRSWLFKRRLAGQGLQRVLVVGRADSVAHLVEQFDREPWHGLVAVGACVPSASEDAEWSLQSQIPVVGDPDAILDTVDDLGVEVVAVASHPDLSGHALRRLAWSLDERGIELIVSPGIIEVAGPRLSIRPVAGLSLLHLDRPVTRGGRMLVKG